MAAGEVGLKPVQRAEQLTPAEEAQCALEGASAELSIALASMAAARHLALRGVAEQRSGGEGKEGEERVEPGWVRAHGPDKSSPGPAWDIC